MPRRRHSLRYLIYLRSPAWRVRRRIWIFRAHGRCEQCGSRRRLTIHHRTYNRLGHERRSDVTVLCWSCHRLQHANRGAVRTRWHWLAPRLTGPLSRRPKPVARLALLILIALPTALVLASWIPHR